MKPQGKSGLLRAFLAACVLLAPVAWASPLDDAKAAGLVKENADGYAVAVENAPKKIQELVADINLRRTEAYKKIAEQTGATVEQVGQSSYLKRHAEE